MSKLQLGNIKVDCFDQHTALQAISKLFDAGAGGTVFTPNVDHVMLAENNKDFALAYDKADISVADGMPIVWASRLFDNKIPERVAGSDLLMPILEMATKRKLRIFFLGSSPSILIKAIDNIKQKIDGFEVVGHCSPIVSNNVSEDEVMRIMRYSIDKPIDLMIVALGAPKQEIFIDKAKKYYPSSVMIGLGASLDFIAGHAKRSPKWMQRFGLEWVWRLCQEPKRLWRRYLRDFKFPFVIWKQLRLNATITRA